MRLSLRAALLCGAYSTLIWAMPGQARFLQVDPIGYDDQINLYAYVGNDPANMSDSTGQRSEVVGNHIRIVPCDRSYPTVPFQWGGQARRVFPERKAPFTRMMCRQAVIAMAPKPSETLSQEIQHPEMIELLQLAES